MKSCDEQKKIEAYKSVARLLVMTEFLRILELKKDSTSGYCDLNSITEINWKTKRESKEKLGGAKNVELEVLKKTQGTEDLQKIKKEAQQELKALEKNIAKNAYNAKQCFKDGEKERLEEARLKFRLAEQKANSARHKLKSAQNASQCIGGDLEGKVHETRTEGEFGNIEFENTPSRIINLNNKLKNQMYEGNFLFDLINKTMISVDDIYGAIQDEKYLHEYAVEHFLLAFAASVFSSTDDMRAFLKVYSNMREQIFTEKYIKDENNKSTSETVNFAKKMRDSLITILPPDMPYDDPVEYLYAAAYDNEGKEIIIDFAEQKRVLKFSDCVETAIRHIFNFVLGKNGIENFDGRAAAALKTRVFAFCEECFIGQIPDRINKLEEFYKTYKLNPNCGDAPARDLWNRVVYNLGNGIEYGCTGVYRDMIGDKNAIGATIGNIINAISCVLGINPKELDKKIVENNTNKRIIMKLKTLFKIISGKEYTFENIRIDNAYSGWKIARKDGQLYSFILALAGGHAYVKLPTRNLSPIDLTNTTFATPNGKIIKSLAGYIYNEYSDNIYSKVFGYSQDDHSIHNGDFYDLTKKAVVAMYDSHKNHKTDEVKILETFMENIIRTKYNDHDGSDYYREIYEFYETLRAIYKSNPTIHQKVGAKLNNTLNDRMMLSIVNYPVVGNIENANNATVEFDDENEITELVLSGYVKRSLPGINLSNLKKLEKLTIDSDTYVDFSTINKNTLKSLKIKRLERDEQLDLSSFDGVDLTFENYRNEAVILPNEPNSLKTSSDIVEPL
ncbi:hypothetical protein FACS189449_09630 [Alphaproteobacteria bacterium]|nr:hypothetical protein FACS189449_09630 [Alphaproteobacteria bacterium]